MKVAFVYGQQSKGKEAINRAGGRGCEGRLYSVNVTSFSNVTTKEMRRGGSFKPLQLREKLVSKLLLHVLTETFQNHTFHGSTLGPPYGNGCFTSMSHVELAKSKSWYLRFYIGNKVRICFFFFFSRGFCTPYLSPPDFNAVERPTTKVTA